MPKRRLRSAPKWNANADRMRRLSSPYTRIFFPPMQANIINIINIDDTYFVIYTFSLYLINEGQSLQRRKYPVYHLSALFLRPLIRG